MFTNPACPASDKWDEWMRTMSFRELWDMRKGENPGEVIANLKDKIEELNQNVLPEDVRIIPFYDREDLVNLAVKTVTII